jgi:distribution and morphology protein 31
VLDLKFPRDTTPDALNALLEELADAITPAALTDLIPGQRELAKPPLVAPDDPAESIDATRIIVDIDLRFKDLKAAVPVFARDLSYASNALIRPIVAFMK